MNKTFLFRKGDPKKINEQMMVLICRRLYKEASSLGWATQVHFTVTSSHDEVKVEVEYEDNVGFHVQYYQNRFMKFEEELTPYFTN